MEKEEDLLEAEIEEDDDLFNISLDDLTTEDITEENSDEESDDDIIELLDLIEKGDKDFLSLDDDAGKLSADDIPTEELNDVTEEDFIFDNTGESDDTGSTPQPELNLSSVLDESDFSDLVEDSGDDQPIEGMNLEEDSGLTADDESSNGTDIPAGDLDDSGDSLEELFGEGSSEELFSDDGEGLGNIDDILSEESDIPEEELGEDLDMSVETSPDSEEFPDDLLADTEEGVSDDDLFLSEYENSDGDLKMDTAEDSLVSEESQESESDEGEQEGLFADEDFLSGETGEQADFISDLEDSDEAFDDLITSDDEEDRASDDIAIDDIENVISSIESEKQDELTDESLTENDLLQFEENLSEVIDEDFSDDMTLADESLILESDQSDGISDEQGKIESDELETIQQAEVADVPVSAPPVSDIQESQIISEERIEKIVTKVVGDVLERVARETFTEVAEKIIKEAIDSLKKSLDTDSE